MQDVRTNRSLSYEEEVLFQRYGINAYDTDAPGMLDGATPAEGDHQDRNSGEGLTGSED